MAEPEFTVRNLRAEELPLIRDWADAEGWDPGVHDGQAHYAADPGGFFVGELAGEPVACVSCVAYDESFGFLGQYIVRPGHRGNGYGLRTWQAGVAHLGGRNVGLDGVLAQQANYERSGFRLAHQDIRFRGPTGGQSPPGLVPLSSVPFGELLGYDRTCFPAPRTEFLRRWVALPESKALAAWAGGELGGYGVVRRSADGWKVGPLFADGAGVAESLYRGLVSGLPAGDVSIDVPAAESNPEAEALARRLGLRELFRTARMYTRGVPALRARRVFGITTMELG